MREERENTPVRLKGKTALRLRRAAGHARMVCLAAGILFSLGMAAAAVYAGVRWLPAVPICVLIAVLGDLLLWLRAERLYFGLTAQALCAEEALRALRDSDSRRERARRAERERMEVIRDAVLGEGPAKAEEEDEEEAVQKTASIVKLLKPETGNAEPAREEGRHRRRGSAGEGRMA